MTWPGRPPLGQVQMIRPLSLAPAKARGACCQPVRSDLKLYLKIARSADTTFSLRQDVAQAELVRPPLADELVGHAAGADLALALQVVGQVLLEVLPVPAELDELLLALLEDAVEAVGGGRVARAGAHSSPARSAAR